MFFRLSAVAMVWNDPGEVKCQGDGCALGQLLRSGIEDIRRKLRCAAIAGKEIAAEHESEPLAVEAHMPVGMAGEMDRAQTVPYVDQVAVVEQAVRNERLEW